MSPEFLEKIWVPFEQERRAASQNGTGLGTTLSKTLVEKMGGRISVESHLDKGTVFTIILPLEIVQPKEAPSASAAGNPAGGHADFSSRRQRNQSHDYLFGTGRERLHYI